MGKKYIIELEDENYHQYSDSEPSDYLWRVKGFNALVFDEVGISKLTPYTEPDLERVRKEAYDKGLSDGKNQDAKDFSDIYDSGYSEGLKDAWDAARKIRDMTWKEQREVFGTDIYADIIVLSASECIEKIRQYEQKKEEQIQVGDEIETPSGLKGYVVNFTDDELVHYVSSEGRFGTMGMSAVSKTGRHFPEIAEVLKKMREH